MLALAIWKKNQSNTAINKNNRYTVWSSRGLNKRGRKKELISYLQVAYFISVVEMGRFCGLNDITESVGIQTNANWRPSLQGHDALL